LILRGVDMYKSYECQICHYVYEEVSGEFLVGVDAGTRWEELGEEFQCPHCQAKKRMFREVVS
jgi:rubredoxin